MNILSFFKSKKKKASNVTFFSGQRGYINLYHHLSRELWYDIANKKLIRGEKATEVSMKSKREIGFVPIEQGIKADVWGDGKSTTIYGKVYELC